MLFLSALTAAFAATAAATGFPNPKCTDEMRVRYSKQVGIAYNSPVPGQEVTEFAKVPWGSPDESGTCLTTIIPNGSGCAIPVATTGLGTRQFAIETRQVFYHLNDTAVIPFKNGTVLYSVNIQLGGRDRVPLPANFHGWVYMDFNVDCRIYSARAYADVPNEVLGKIVSFPLPNVPACKLLPIGGQKKREIAFEA